MGQWLELYTRFMALVNQEELSYDVDYRGTNEYGEWDCFRGAKSKVRIEFELIATEAGLKLSPPAEVRPLHYWLHRVLWHFHEKTSDLVSLEPSLWGFVPYACLASAQYCADMEIEFLEKGATAPALPGVHLHDLSEEPIGAQLNRLREECRLTVEELAEKVSIDPRSVWRHISGKSMPRPGNIRAYEQVFSKVLGRTVIISGASGKRQ